MEDWINRLNAAAKMALYSDNVSKTSKKADSNISQELLQYDIVDDFEFKESNLTEEELRTKYELINKVKGIPGNKKCADCKADDPQWASTNYGILLCIECSGIHRSLGVHISKVRSLMLDKWEQESVDIMLNLGNLKVNEIFEAKLDKDYKNRIITNSSWKREEFIIDKYVKKKFIALKVDEDSNSLEIINLKFWNAMNQTNLYEALRCLALGANVDWKNQEKNSTTSLHQAVQRNDQLALEFLFLWQADVNSVDKDSRSVLHYAAVATNNDDNNNNGDDDNSNDIRVISTLLKRNANVNIRDKDGKLPVDFAIDSQNIEAILILNSSKSKKSENSNLEEEEGETTITVFEPYNETSQIDKDDLYF